MVPVQRIVRGTQVENDLSRWPLVCLQEYIDQQPLDRFPVVGGLVIARRVRPAPARVAEQKLRPVPAGNKAQNCIARQSGREARDNLDEYLVSRW